MLCSKKTSQPIRKIEAINRPRILFIFLPNILFTIKEFLEYENLSIQLPRKYPQPLIHRQSIIFVPHRISSCSTFRFSIIVTLFLFATTFYITYTTGKEIQRTMLDNFFGFLCNAYASSWIVNTAATILVLYMVGKWQGWQFHPLTAANHIATWGGIGGAFGLIVSGLSMFSAGNLIPSANISSLCTPSTLIDATTIGALIGSVFALPSYSFSCFSKDTPIWTKLFAPLIQSVISLATMPYISPNAFLQKMISSSSPNRVLAQLKAQVENVTSESQVAALINKDWRLILIAADQEEFRQFFSNNTYITVTLTVMAIPIVIILRKQFSIVMEKSY